MNNISSLPATSSPVTPLMRTTAGQSATPKPDAALNTMPLPVNRINQPTTAQPTENELQQAVEQANKVLESKTSKELQFSVDKSTGISVVKMINQQTGETLLQFPSDAMLQIAKYIDQQTGALVSKKA